MNSTNICLGLPHTYSQVNSTPVSASAQEQFKSLTYFKPNPWRPSPLILSLGHSFSLDAITTTRALDEWASLATGAERNIPMLFLGPHTSASKNSAISKYAEKIAKVAKGKHFDVLNLYNLTLQAS